jgi:hypothetical protein
MCKYIVFQSADLWKASLDSLSSHSYQCVGVLHTILLLLVISHYQPQALTVIDSHDQIEYIYNVRRGEVDVEWRCQ